VGYSLSSVCLFTGLIHNPYAISPPPNLSFIKFSVLFQSALPSLVLYSPLFTFSIFSFGPLLSSYSPSLPFCFSSLLSPSLFFLIFSRSSLLSYLFLLSSFSSSLSRFRDASHSGPGSSVPPSSLGNFCQHSENKMKNDFTFHL
jgi:hypothetical protein